MDESTPRTGRRPVPRGTGRTLALALVPLAALALTSWTIRAWAEPLPGPVGEPLVRWALPLLVLVPLVGLLCRAERVPPAAIGLTTPGRAWRPLLAALLACPLAAAPIVGGAVLTGGASLDTSALAPAALAALIAALLTSGQVAAEELVFRGHLQHRLGTLLSPLAALFTQAALFAGVTGLVLGESADPFGLVLSGVLFGLLRTAGGIWAPFGARLSLTWTTVLLAQADLAFASNAPIWNTLLSVATGVAAYLAVRRTCRTDHQGAPPSPEEPAPRHRRALPVRGVLYDVGSSYIPGQHSRERWNPDAVHEDLRVIREDLHCTAVTLFGHDLERLERAALSALGHGLDVWLQPRSLNAKPAELVEHVGHAADLARRLDADHPGRVVLNVGCELTVLNRGILPGRDVDRRARALAVFGLFPAYHDARLNALLRRLAATARERFAGPLTYGSGTWERVDWTPFDLVGVDYYLDELTRPTYRRGLRALERWDRPVVVTEFGCCSYRGAEALGGGGADALDWSDLDDRRVTGGLVRDEGVQADTVERLLDVYETENVHGAFLCMFVEGDCRPSDDPARDCDMASFGIVRPPPLGSGLSSDDGHWEPKEGFHALARRYGAAAELPR
ncbi:CPBP family glutamic-type intramembrane protease [Nocardiopsis sp. NPDC007018]|uniref:CPBP family glutamic-type intramembrane protease n=1 Tax=Nocardiopsis sp. NPDC007018 TaxID=3155721 RepID=UPI00340027AE